MTGTLTGISSMATREILAELSRGYHTAKGVDLRVESVGGVDAAKRVAAGEAFDLVFLASDALDKLIASGHVVAASKINLARSSVAIAIPSGAARPNISSETALKAAVLAAPSIGYSTGPSGTALLKLFERWGIDDAVRARLVQAPPGVPVGKLVAEGKVALAFQQMSELMNISGVDLLGVMPPGCEIITTFSAAICATSRQVDAAHALLIYLTSPETAAVKQRQGMEPA